MKVRQGFVSNSSSSSFIINNEEWDIDNIEYFMEELENLPYSGFDSDDYIISYVTNGDIRIYGLPEYSLGYILLQDSGDNGIPSKFSDIIEDTFQAEKW